MSNDDNDNYDDETKPYAQVLKEYYMKNKKKAKKIVGDKQDDEGDDDTDLTVSRSTPMS